MSGAEKQPWLLTIRFWPVSREARDDIVNDMRVKGEEKYWDDTWAARDHKQDSRHVRSGKWAWPYRDKARFTLVEIPNSKDKKAQTTLR